jgi:hypothetical protein
MALNRTAIPKPEYYHGTARGIRAGAPRLGHGALLVHEQEWLANSGLASNTISLTQSLIYHRGQSACFSDVEILSVLPSDAERHRLVRTLSRNSTRMVVPRPTWLDIRMRAGFIGS